MEITNLPLSKLRIADTNVRKTKFDTGLKELAGNIHEAGIINPLQVAPSAKKGTYDIFAGGRRYRALLLLASNGLIDKNFAVPVQISSKSQIEQQQISWAENVIREDMTPGDEMREFKRFAGDAPDIPALAKRFGCTEVHVQRRLRLADLAEPIFDAFDSGKMTLDAAMAYASTADQNQQLAVWSRLGQHSNAQAIKRAIHETKLASNSMIAMFVGEADYLAAGGSIETDLFSENGKFWLDVPLAHKLAESRMNEAAKQIADQNELGWITPLLNSSVTWQDQQKLIQYYPPRKPHDAEALAKLGALENDITAMQEQLEDEDLTAETSDALQDKYNKLVEEYHILERGEPYIPDEHKPFVGTFVTIGENGEPHIENQLYSTKKLTQLSSTTTQLDETSPPTTKDSDHSSQKMSQRLTDELAMQKRDVLALYLAQCPIVALDLMIYQMALSSARVYGSTGSTIAINPLHDPISGGQAEPSHATQLLKQTQETLDDSWINHQDHIASFKAFCALDDDAKMAWLTYTVATSLQAIPATNNLRFTDHLAQLLDVKPADHWRPTASNYFDRVSKATILKHIADLGDPQLPNRYAMAKKADLALTAEKIFNGSAMIEPTLKESALKWLPSAMTFLTSDAGTTDETNTIEDIKPDVADPSNEEHLQADTMTAS